MGVDSEGAKGAKVQVTPGAFDFGTTTSTASVTIQNPTKRAMAWSVSESAKWLSLSATSGTLWAGDTRVLSMTASRSGLSAGTYSVDVKFSASNGGGTEVMPVSVSVPSSGTEPARLAVSPVEVDFGTTGTNRSVTLSNTGDASLTWTASENTGWLSLGATSGSISGRTSQTLTLTAQRDGLTAGTYTTALTFSAGTAGTVTESVLLTVPSTSSSTVLLAGRLIDQFGEQGLGGVTVAFKGATATTAPDGSFTIPGSPTTSPSTLTLTGAGLYRRVTNAQTGDALWRVVPTSFDINAFDDMARDDFGSTTVRWVAAPTVYVDTRPEGFAGGPELQKWISQVQVQAADFVSKWTGATMDPANVIVTSSPPRDFSAGTIVIHFSEDASRYENSAYIGYARLSWSSSRSISGAAVWLRYLRYSGDAYASKRMGILGHELGHAMGMGHMEGSTPSFMSPSLGSKTDLSAFDQMAAFLLYTRMPGSSTADVEGSSSPSKALAPSAFTVTEWVCGAETESPSP